MANTSIKTIKPFSNNDNQEKLPIATLVTPQESKKYERQHDIQPYTQQNITQQIDTRYSVTNRTAEQVNKSPAGCCTIQ